MSQDKQNIDQLFRAKLRDFEVTPPLSAWEHIVNELDVRQRAGNILFLRRAGAAAAVVALFLGGWWLYHQNGLNESHENAASVSPKSEITYPVTSAQVQSETVQLPVAENKMSNNIKPRSVNAKKPEYKPSLTSMASFAPGTTLLNKYNETTTEGTKETGLVDIEKEFLSHYQNNVGLIRQFSDWVTSLEMKGRIKDTIHAQTQAIAATRPSNAVNINIPSLMQVSGNETSEGKKGSWTLSAGLSPFTVTQRQGGSSVSGQQTSFENSVSGSMLAGYKIDRRITVKSGIILNQLKQVTRITDYPSAYRLEAFAFKTAHLSTTSGSVKLDKAVLIKSDVLFSSDVAPSPGTQPELKQEFSYVEIPVQMVYKLIDHKFNLGVTGGVSTNILSGNKAGLYDNGQRINQGRTSNLRDITYSGAIGLEFGYDLNNKVTLTVEPHIKRFLNSVSSNQEIDLKPYQFDIMTGVTYSFN